MATIAALSYSSGRQITLCGNPDEIMSQILPLPMDTIAQIHSSRNITSLQGVVLALLENSLDAGSSKVDITVDFRRGGCTVEDNGSGIQPNEFLENGGLLKMYHTSKQAEPETNALHGITGTYLASLSALSLISIASRHHNHDQSASLVAHQGKVISRQVPASEIDDVSLSNSHGTCITVRDLFGNMPVRVKQRASASDKANLDAKEWFELKSGIVALLLAWPRPCNVRLRDAETGTKVLRISSMRSNGNADLTKRGLEELAGKDVKFDVQDVLPILAQAGLAPVESRSNWIPVSASTLKVSVRGAVCLDPSPTKHCQFISIGVHPCALVAGGSDLYDLVNKLFNNSSFGALDDEENIDDAEKDRRRHDRRYKSDGYTQKQTHGRKGVDRWPMFMLQIKLRDQRSRIQPERMNESSLKAIIDVLEAMITQWLTTNHFQPRRMRRRKEQDCALSSEASPQHSGLESRDVRTPVYQPKDNSAAATTSKKRKFVDMAGNLRNLEDNPTPSPIRPNDYFSSWSRIKSGRSAYFEDDFHGRKPATAPAERKGSLADAEVAFDRRGLNLPVVGAGELNARKSLHCPLNVSLQQGTTPACAHSMPPADDRTSSDDYGSFDDEQVLVAVGTVEHESKVQLYSKDNGTPGEVTAPSQDPIADDSIVEWIDPKTKKVFKINARTGVVLPSRPKSAAQASYADGDQPLSVRQRAGIDTSVSSKGQPLSLARRPKSKPTKDVWLTDFLQTWNNPVFAQQSEDPIPATAGSLADFDASREDSGHHTHENGAKSSGGDAPLRGASLTKRNLRDARVIKQVDEKYILCETRHDSGTGRGDALVLVDQHAASERVILEELLAELCSPRETTVDYLRSNVKTTAIEKPLRFQISKAEHRLFQTHAEHFAKWGIGYQLADKQEILGASQVRTAKREYTIIVENLPPGIVERCVLVPRLLIDLLRSEVCVIEESAEKRHPNSTAADENKPAAEEHGWLRRLGSCPKGILDMLNSRACRSAIMFNDELSVVQCQQLVSDLSKCAFPFMCAHGRVSMIPLVEAGYSFVEEDEATMASPHGDGAHGFSEAFRAWQAKEISSKDRTINDR